MEREELAGFIDKAARLAGLDIGEDEDITEKWREWSCDRTEKKGGYSWINRNMAAIC
ncbi:hypothetical protein [Paenibacillus hubeiensis]|uniref:hypothetical protein n=1 Tax=Paenibacillus hubeiensis TaxID=3077330 RepID=UPI0031BA4437